jgi:hypothetical protein
MHFNNSHDQDLRYAGTRRNPSSDSYSNSQITTVYNQHKGEIAYLLDNCDEDITIGDLFGYKNQLKINVGFVPFIQINHQPNLSVEDP